MKSNRKKNKSALIVFAREPKDGKVKTRLRQNLPAKFVTRFYKAFVRDVLQSAAKARCDERFLFYAGHGSSISFLRRSGRGFHLKRQSGGDLGQRLFNAFVRCQKNRFNRVVIIGTDCLTINKNDIELAFEQLNTYDCVLGPAHDGGYYLIGLNKPEKGLFKGIHWSTESVLDQTVQNARRLNKKVFFMRRTLTDIDTIEHLRDFSKRTTVDETGRHTLKILRSPAWHQYT